MFPNWKRFQPKTTRMEDTFGHNLVTSDIKRGLTSPYQVRYGADSQAQDAGIEGYQRRGEIAKLQSRLRHQKERCSRSRHKKRAGKLSYCFSATIVPHLLIFLLR